MRVIYSFVRSLVGDPQRPIVSFLIVVAEPKRFADGEILQPRRLPLPTQCFDTEWMIVVAAFNLRNVCCLFENGAEKSGGSIVFKQSPFRKDQIFSKPFAMTSASGDTVVFVSNRLQNSMSPSFVGIYTPILTPSNRDGRGKH
jgi:hypothetical protein